MYNAKERSRANFDRQAAIYDTASFGAHARKLYPILLAQLAQIPHRWVLDVGCGTGELLFQMARRWPGGTYRGVDLSPKMAAMARNKLGRPGPGRPRGRRAPACAGRVGSGSGV